MPCPGVANPDKELLTCVARTALRSKLREDLADKLTSIVVDAVCLIAKKDEPIDLHMVEIMHMRHKLDSDTRLVSGLVLDHGARHPDMKKHVDDAFILTCNIGMEYEKSEVNSSFMYSDAEQRERMVAAEREYTDDVVRQVIALKKKVCDGNDKGFVVITQKGIDPISLDMLAKEGIVGLRRAKKRNMERRASCGGVHQLPRGAHPWRYWPRRRRCTSTSSARRSTPSWRMSPTRRAATSSSRGPTITPSRSSRTRSGTAFGR